MESYEPMHAHTHMSNTEAHLASVLCIICAYIAAWPMHAIHVHV